MSLLAAASCDQPLGIIGGVAMCGVCVRVHVRKRAMLLGWGLWAGQSETREYPMRTREIPWQPETGSTLNGAPPFILHRATTLSQNDRDGERRDGWREGGGVNPASKYLNGSKKREKKGSGQQATSCFFFSCSNISAHAGVNVMCHNSSITSSL